MFSSQLVGKYTLQLSFIYIGAKSLLLAKATVQLWDVNQNLFLFFVDIKQTVIPRGTHDSNFPHIKRYLYNNIQQGYADFTHI